MNCNFNPRSREGSDSNIHRQYRGNDHFNPRSREGSDAIWKKHFTEGITFQSTLPRRERRDLEKAFYGGDNISIHAPAKGATGELYIKQYRCHISIHAPAKGATDSMSAVGVGVEDFNPRSREGSDSCLFCAHSVYFSFQSTLPRRERPLTAWIMLKFAHFNPRSREGSDRNRT